METEAKPRPYTDEEVEAKIQERGLDGWYLDGGWLRRKYNTDGWPTTLMLVNAIGYLSEAAYHHPDLAVTWGKVWVKLKTHTSDGITDKDFAWARETGHPVLGRQDPHSPLGGPPNKSLRRKTKPRRIRTHPWPS